MADTDGNLTDVRVVIVVADDQDTAGRGERAVQASGAATILRIGWLEAPAKIADTPRLAGVFCATHGVADEALVDLLRAVATAGDARLVVELNRDQIDTVAAAMLPTDTILLCEPSEAERTAAMALATLDDRLSARDTSRDARRFEQLNAEVARFAETLARLTASDAPAYGDAPRSDPFVADRVSGFGAEPAATIDPTDIRRAIRARRLRDDAFDQPGLFEDPAWDMLLDLFAAELERQRVSVSSLCIAAAVAPTTALRWIGKLIEAGLLERRPDDFDRRRAFISLTARASTAMRNYMAMLKRAGLAIA